MEIAGNIAQLLFKTKNTWKNIDKLHEWKHLKNEHKKNIQNIEATLHDEF
jgi:hypothetical protein